MRRAVIVAVFCIAVAASAGGALYYQRQLENNANTSCNSSNSNGTPTLPSYLGEYVSGNLAYHAHAHLRIVLNGMNQTIPALIGISGACLHPLHTHTSDGTIHIEPDQDRNFTLGDFFLVWDQPFNSTQILSQRYQPGQLSMTVNEIPNSQLWNYIIPKNAESTTNPCSDVPCQDTEIVITFTASGY